MIGHKVKLSNNLASVEISTIEQIEWLKAIGIQYYYSEELPAKAPVALHTNNDTVIAEPTRPIKQPNMQFIKSPAIAPNTGLENFSQKASRELADSANTIAELREIVMNFDGCELKKLATNTVFADGNPKAKIMLIGEAPGASEDAQGIPFCGDSGKLLDKMLASIGLSRESNAYITNTIFWRPPANRQPTTEEIEICRPFVEKHIALIDPALIILVGSTAATSLLGNNAGISKIRQEYYQYTNQYLQKPITTTALFHPAYLLRQPMQKKTTWYDLLKIQQYIS